MKKLFVGNLPYAANETDLQNFFAEQRANGKPEGQQNGARLAKPPPADV